MYHRRLVHIAEGETEGSSTHWELSITECFHCVGVGDILCQDPPPHRAFANIESLKPRARERTVPSTYTIRPFEPTAAYIRHPGIRRLAGNYPHRPGRCQSHIRSFHCPSNDGFRVEVTEIRMYTGTHTETRKVHCSSHRASRHTYHCPRAYHILLRKY